MSEEPLKERLQDKYDDNDYVYTDHPPGVEMDKAVARLAIADIKVRISSNIDNYDTVVEIYRRQQVSIRTDKQNGYIQDIYYINHDKIPFEAVVDELKLIKNDRIDVEKNRTDYTINPDSD